MSSKERTVEQERTIEAFLDALEEGSVDKVLACYAPDARIWHNFDQLSLTPEESVTALPTLFENFPKREYVDVRRQPTSEGFVQQHILRLERTDGTLVDWPGCIVFELAGGKIVRLDEYVDLGALAPP